MNPSMDPRRAPLFSVGGGLSTWGAGGVAVGGGGATDMLGKELKISN